MTLGDGRPIVRNNAAGMTCARPVHIKGDDRLATRPCGAPLRLIVVRMSPLVTALVCPRCDSL